jgi:hypothetical protein
LKLFLPKKFENFSNPFKTIIKSANFAKEVVLSIALWYFYLKNLLIFYNCFERVWNICKGFEIVLNTSKYLWNSKYVCLLFALAVVQST